MLRLPDKCPSCNAEIIETKETKLDEPEKIFGRCPRCFKIIYWYDPILEMGIYV